MQKLSEILKHSEGRKLEFKEALPTSSDLAKTIIAFANDAGGEFYLGIRDKTREIIGIDENKLIATEEKISNIIHDHCQPVIIPEISFLKIKDKHIIKVQIYKGSEPPYFLKQKGKANGTFIRVGSSNRQATPEIIEELERHFKNISFDSELSHHKTIDWLNIDSFKSLYQEKTDEPLSAQVLKKLDLFKPQQAKNLPTNALILLSDDELRKKVFPYAKIECARFKGTKPGNFIDQKSIEENISIQAELAYQFVLRHISEGSVDYTGVFRKDRWEYPVIAIREAIRNAVIHRDYSLTGKDIKLAIFDDKLEITSPGKLLPSVDFNDMDAGQSDIRNKILAPVFKKMGIIEQWGNGLRLISDELQKYPEIGFEWKEPGIAFRVTFYKKDFAADKINDQVSDQDNDQVNDQDNDQVSEQIRMVLKHCLTPKTRNEILQHLGYKNHFDNFKRYIEPALNSGLLEMTIPDKPNSRNQKYVITVKGKSLLKKKKQ